MVVLVIVITNLPLSDGAIGEVVKHNLDNDIDATPLFYSEVEGIFEMSNEITDLHQAVKSKARGKSHSE